MYEDYFSDRLSKLRTQKGVSARDMSLSLGQSENYINMIENKKNLPSMVAFFHICEYLEISPSNFFDDKKIYPGLLNELNEELIKLDEDALKHIMGIVKELNKRYK
jgi:transcriptional regulator with XRE-family HTH domain